MRQLGLKATALLFAAALAGCDTGRPVSKVAKIELRPASRQACEDMESQRLVDSDQDFYVAKSPLLTNRDIATVERIRDPRGEPAIALNFTKTGTEAMSKFTSSPGDKMIALVIDGNLTLVVAVTSEIRDSAMISGAMTRRDINGLYVMLTATEVTPADKPQRDSGDREEGTTKVRSGNAREKATIDEDG